MIYSMTGYGRAEMAVNENVYLVELKALNGKQLEIRLNIPSVLRSREMEIRKIIAEKLVRGSVECIMVRKQNGSSRPVVINENLLKSYYKSIKQVADELNLDTDNVLNTLLILPEVVSSNADQITDEEWSAVETLIVEAAVSLNEFRKKEGSVLEKDILKRINNIEHLEEQNAKLAPLRKEKIKENIQKLISENIKAENVDQNRLEQELIYYIEKLDITEEQVRLRNHCNYFKELLKEEAVNKGKKLSFLLQEIGREINTTGSKANDADIQRNVVNMKDELEKAKEQLFNVL